MYNKGTVIPMKSRVISSFLFDQQGHFAGLVILDSTTGETEQIVSQSQPKGKLSEVIVDKEILESARHTRVVGFRTSKRCAGSKNITGVQPIYYSIDEQMCKEYLEPVTDLLLSEPTGHGPECQEIRMQQVEWRAEFDKK